MAIKLYYKENDSYVEVTQTTPVSTTHDGKDGDTISVQLFIKNDDATKWYSTVTIRPIDKSTSSTTDDTIYSDTGWGVKLSPGSQEPTLSFWNSLDWGEMISMGNIGIYGVADISTYFPLWYLITCPPNTDAQTKQNISLKIEFTENAV